MPRVRPLYSTFAGGDGDRVIAGNAARKDVGTIAGTVAAGDDSRITGAVPTSRTISTTAPLTGGGALSGDITLAIADTAVTPGSYGSATQVGTFTVDEKGRLTAAANVAISAGGDAAHVAAGDPHTQYALEAALGTAALSNIGADLEETAGEVCASDDHRLWGPNFGAYRNAFVHANVGASTPLAAGTTVTTRSTSNADATDATGAMETRTTAATVNSAAGWWVGGAPILTARQLAPELLCVIKTPADITLGRWMVGWQSAENSADNPAGHHAVLAYSVSRGDSGWVLLMKDGTTQTVSGTVLAIAAATRYVIRAKLAADGTFSGDINGTAWTTSTTPPASTTALGVIAQVAATTNSARSITIGRLAHRSL